MKQPAEVLFSTPTVIAAAYNTLIMPFFNSLEILLKFTVAWVLHFSVFANVKLKLTREIASPSGPCATRVVSAPLLPHYCDSCLTHAVLFYCIVTPVPITAK